MPKSIPSYTKLQDEEYYKTGRWKCINSPTNSHHWIVTNNGKNSVCKYCHETRLIVPEKQRWVRKDNVVHL